MDQKLEGGTTIKSIMPVLIIPIVSALICCLAYLYILVGPLGALMKALTGMLSGMQGGSAILLGIVIGVMTAFDMGGPINKNCICLYDGFDGGRTVWT